MKVRISAVALLALVVAGCNRGSTTDSAPNAVAPAAASPGNLVIAPPMAPPAMGNAAATEGGAVTAEGCAGEIGQRAADQLVLQCRDVSPATRPPCNTANSCEMIRSEITRGCGMLGDDAPEYCPPAR